MQLLMSYFVIVFQLISYRLTLSSNLTDLDVLFVVIPNLYIPQHEFLRDENHSDFEVISSFPRAILTIFVLITILITHDNTLRLIEMSSHVRFHFLGFGHFLEIWDDNLPILIS
jgi:hypothetical protein